MKNNIRKIVFFMLVIQFQFLNAQNDVGYHIDLDGNPIEGYYDPIAYSPETSISKIHQSSSYEKGYYYDNSGHQVHGQILFENNKIFFREKNEIRNRIKPTEISSIVLGVDSFFAISNFYFKNRLKEHPEFVQYVTEFDGYTFVKHHHFTSAMGQQYGMRAPVISTYLVKAEGDSIWYNFPNTYSLKEKALKYFGHIPVLKTKITSKSFSHKDMEGIIQMAEYYTKYQNAHPIHFDQYWQETKDPNRTVYSANVVNIVDSIWTIEYAQGETRLYSIQYSSFSPFTKHGTFSSFYPNGTLRQTTIFHQNEPKIVKTFTERGELIKHYQYKETDVPYSYDKKTTIHYLTVNEPLLQNNKGLNLTQNYKNKTLLESYFTSGLDTIYQITDPYYKLNIRGLKKRFGYYINSNTYKQALHDNAQGTILVSFVMDPKGFIVSAKRLNTLHPEIDSLLNDFFSKDVLKTSRYGVRLKPYKINKTKEYCEFVVPFQFGINRFYRKPLTYDYNHFHMMHMQHMQMNQQAILNSIR